MSHLWKSLGQKRTVTGKCDPSPRILAYLSDMRDATRMALTHALVDAKLNGGKILYQRLEADLIGARIANQGDKKW